MSDLTLSAEGLVKRFGRTTALDGVDIALPRGAFTVLLGAAGAGKTTTLRTIAGLEAPDAGRVLINGRDVTALEPKDRDVAMIFDSLALYPNKTGFQNIASPLHLRGFSPEAIEAKVGAVAATLKVSHILQRFPKTMSGGERQRIALGRALVRDPVFFLLDEPLSSLDAMLRVELRAELKRLQRERGGSFLYATPDFAEALAVADMVIMLVEGRVRQVAPPQTLYDEPADRDVARFFGAPEINLLAAEYDPSEGGRIRLGESVLPATSVQRRLFDSAPAQFEAGLRPEHIRLAPACEDAAGAPGEIVDLEPLGLNVALTVRSSAAALRVTAPAARASDFAIGAPVRLTPQIEMMLAFDPETGRRIG